MIPKSNYRFSEKIMLKQQAKAKWLIQPNPIRFSRSRLNQAARAPWGGYN
jgi:hypothetical protein